ncbi:MAG: AI-2E family transporter [Chloroflexi bacterium]|nr:AI-2E family transporter [Chloroflexota bacterium]MDA1239289.1 AI-2E family transporter [Chloroflexota bacterium]
MTLQRWRVALWLLTLALALLVAWNARGTLFPFLLGAIFAYALSPIVDWLERYVPPRGERRETVRRGLAVMLIYLAVFGSVGTAGVLLAPTAIDQATRFVDELPGFIDGAREQLNTWVDDTRGRLPVEVTREMDRSTAEFSSLLSDAAVAGLKRTAGVLTGSLGMLFGFAIVPFWMFYAMRDRHLMERSLLRAVPPSLQPDVQNVARMADRLVSRYIRGQLFLGLIVGVAVGAGLTLMNVELALGLGVWAGITELIPIVGPWLGAAAGLIIVAATDPDKIIWVALLYFAIQQLENNLLVPRIQGQAVDMHPAAVVMLLAIAGAVWGLLGMLVVIPMAAILREIFWYSDRRLRGETPERAFHQSGVNRHLRGLAREARMNGAPVDATATPPEQATPGS